ncbi:FAD/NAD(P)-binding domain-containing protein [Fragilariopsis cylindrus CCMP1102]|uniref:FAD/NAD(P)-binding domain-containing protein n=1 Tax=Fragilariopsis cylindrus CCMP1102 TaxID=635003 RepID=A0A1E7FFB3_9STRA|nr:FAD/NAD(P)-binding domain-containing protein [Fragilariopsis cylindrus CCMP1102]|eukprot:OEU16860.1 FAD/NAD(P)-binding domain-containing protein [Fragilariopsis cylindrus CCMP1102]
MKDNEHIIVSYLNVMVVIIGAGIVGAATAYYLSNNDCGAGTSITILDAVELAKELQLESFVRVNNYHEIRSSGLPQQKQTKSIDDNNEWLKDLIENGECETMIGDAALVDPAELTCSMLDKALSSQYSDCSFRQANVTSLEIDPSGRYVMAIHLEGSNEKIELKDGEPVVIALGPWSCRIEDWLAIPMPIEGVVSTSLIYEDGILASDVGTAMFFDEDSKGCHLEVFGRQDKSLYVSGCGESEVISTRVLRSHERPSPSYCPPNMARAAAAQASLKEVVGGFSSSSSISGQPDVIQACIRPTSPDGVPVLGKILDNVYVGTGGGPWGITWGPLMGKSLAFLISNDDNDDDDDDDGPPIRLSAMRPQRYDTFVYRTLLKSRSPNVREIKNE